MHRIFELGYDEYQLFMYNDATIGCTKCNLNWTTDDGWNWYHDGSTGPFGLRDWEPVVFLEGLEDSYDIDGEIVFPAAGDPGPDQPLLDSGLFERPSGTPFDGDPEAAEAYFKSYREASDNARVSAAIPDKVAKRADDFVLHMQEERTMLVDANSNPVSQDRLAQEWAVWQKKNHFYGSAMRYEWFLQGTKYTDVQIASLGSTDAAPAYAEVLNETAFGDWQRLDQADADEDYWKHRAQHILDQRPPLLVDENGKSAYCPFCGSKLEAYVYWDCA